MSTGWLKGFSKRSWRKQLAVAVTAGILAGAYAPGVMAVDYTTGITCLLYTSPSPRDS